jgi:pimeloyl-ACP methyl ester carboxylesterase
MYARTAVPYVLLAALLAACADGDAAGPTLAPEGFDASLTSVPGVTEVVDEIGPGSTFALFKPAGWEDGTRELAVYAHGYVQPFLDPSLPADMDWFRDWLLSQGVAVAYSSYSHTGYAVKDGAVRTHQLRGTFAETFGEPATTYATGVSMGAMVASLLEERYGAQYDGALLLCGVLGGGLDNASYIAHVRLLWDVFFPGTLRGSLTESPDGYLLIPPDASTGYPGSEAYWAIVQAASADFGRAVMLTQMDPVNMEVDITNPTEVITGLLHVLGYQINGANALTDLLHGHSPFDNREVTYSGSWDPTLTDAEINARVARVAADPDAESYLDRWYTPTGRIDDPVVTIHTSRDPLVPGRSTDAYAGRVAAEGNAALLTRFPDTDAFGHCQFQGPEVIAGFLTMRAAALGN